MTDKKEKNTIDTKFSKENLLSAKTFNDKKDILSAVVNDGEVITLKEASDRIKTFMKGKVN